MGNTNYKICPDCGGNMLCLPKGGCDEEGGMCFLEYVWICTSCGKELPVKGGEK